MTQSLAAVGADERLLLAVSGGGDSLAMLNWFAGQVQWRGRLVVAHVNHGLRSDSAEVEYKVQRAAQALDILFVSRQVDVAGELARRAESLEACARRLRYGVLDELRMQTGCAFVVTAHSQDDDAETVAMRLRNNSSWYECTGIPALRGTILRPFLAVRRAELRKFLRADEWTDTDPMNRDFRFPRVQARARLASAEGVAGLLAISLTQHGQNVRDVVQLTERLVKFRINNGLEFSFGRSGCLEILPKNLYLEDLEFICGELRWKRLAERPADRWSAKLRRQVMQFLAGGDRVSRLALPSHITLRRAGEQIWLERMKAIADDPGQGVVEIVTPSAFGEYIGGILAIAKHESDKMYVRPWRPGERFRPRKRRSRKIADWLADARIHPAVRGEWPVVCIENKIVAVPGLGVSECAQPRTGAGTTHLKWRSRSTQHEQLA